MAMLDIVSSIVIPGIMLLLMAYDVLFKKKS